MYKHILMYTLLLLPRSLRACDSLVSNLLELSFLIILALEANTCLRYLVLAKKLPPVTVPDCCAIHISGSLLTMAMASILMSAEQSKWRCQIHGPGFMGHISITKIVTDQRHNDSMDIVFLLHSADIIIPYNNRE